MVQRNSDDLKMLPEFKAIHASLLAYIHVFI